MIEKIKTFQICLKNDAKKLQLFQKNDLISIFA